MHRNWLLNRTNPDFLRYLSEKASVSPLLAQILVNRGIRDVNSVKSFLSPSLGNFHDPFLLPDMDKAVERLKTAIKKNETILVHGDFDADGITATALLVRAFNMLKLKAHYHIPNRISEGYGISRKAILKAKTCGANLIITADCGISSGDEVKYARSFGIDVIITDHHEPPDTLPEAYAIIDPHRKDSGYPFKYLAGVGVAFKLIHALFQNTGNGTHHVSSGTWQIADLKEYFDLVAIGTVADSVPLLDENRVFAAYGLKEVNDDSCRTGIKALKKAAEIEKPMSSGQISFMIVPRINAAGRLDDAGEVVELFLTEDEGKARNIAGLLEEQNRRRQKIEGEVLQSALSMMSPHPREPSIVLSSHDWHPGVIGIVASRLVERFYRPVFLFSVKDSVAKGSARGIPPFHLYNAISECSGLLDSFGGHRQAAGLKIAADNLPVFKEKMNRIIERSLSEEDMTPVLEIDAAVSLSDVNFNLVNELKMLEPFGDSNREPVFGAKNIEIMNHRTVGSNHLKMQVRQDRVSIDTIGFNMADRLPKLGHASSVDIAFVPSINEWNGSRSLQLNLKAMRPGS